LVLSSCLFQQWKVFVDNEVSIVLVGTTHHAVDLAYGNKDLLGRLTHIDIPTWKKNDLEKIARQGFEYMKVEVQRATVEIIASESVGLPIVTQAVCLELLLHKQVNVPLGTSKEVGINAADAFEALHTVAVEKFSAFEAIYERLSRGLRKQRKYKTYELILSSFTLGELSFSATRVEIADRMKQLPFPSSAIPPPTLVARTLTSLAALQSKIGIELLEWRPRDERLYIVEPTFLFYLRWRKGRTEAPSLSTLISEFFRQNDQRKDKLLPRQAK